MIYGYTRDGRRIDPGEGWEIVPEIELDIVPGDHEMDFFSDGKWKPLANASMQSLWAWRSEGNSHEMLAFRRRKKLKPEWLPVNGPWLPLFDERVLAVKSGGTPQVCVLEPECDEDGVQVGLQWRDVWTLKIAQPTHWMRFEPVPQPQKSEAEKAWESYSQPQLSTVDQKAAFIAGFNAGKKG